MFDSIAILFALQGSNLTPYTGKHCSEDDESCKGLMFRLVSSSLGRTIMVDKTLFLYHVREHRATVIIVKQIILHGTFSEERPSISKRARDRLVK